MFKAILDKDLAAVLGIPGVSGGLLDSEVTSPPEDALEPNDEYEYNLAMWLAQHPPEISQAMIGLAKYVAENPSRLPGVIDLVKRVTEISTKTSDADHLHNNPKLKAVNSGNPAGALDVIGLLER